MADATTDPAGESPAQKQARLRRERRNAKLQAGGSDRLNKITSLSGRPAEADAFATPSPSSSPAPAASFSRPRHATAHDADPDEVDISTVFRRPAPQDPTSMDQQALLQQLLRGGGGIPNADLDGASPDIQPPVNDPMMQMMQQMMAGGPGNGSPPGADGMPPGLASMFGQGFPGQQQQPASSADYTWRIVHAICALFLATYTALSLKFPSSATARLYIDESSAAPRLFWMFATAELVLQSTRYFLDGGKMPPGGLLATVAGFLPQPYSGYVQTVSRYSLIYTTIVSDAMVIVFVLGSMAWLRGAAAA